MKYDEYIPKNVSKVHLFSIQYLKTFNFQKINFKILLPLMCCKIKYDIVFIFSIVPIIILDSDRPAVQPDWIFWFILKINNFLGFDKFYIINVQFNNSLQRLI